MAIRKINNTVFEVGAIDWDRALFDELVHLPDGTSYNAYIVKGSEKTALIDSVDPEKTSTLLDNLKSLKLEKLDYVIANHAEQDHSGAIPAVLKMFPEAKVVTNLKCKNMLIDHLHIDEKKFITVKDKDTLSLGDKNFEFRLTPWVHWPETMITYLKEDKIFFTCDFFGAHRAASNLYVTSEPKVYFGAKRYYAEIMMPFRKQIEKHLEMLKEYDIDFIAPSHGPVHNKPKFIIDAYTDWVSPGVKNKVLIPYVSMHGSTKIMVEKLTDALIDKGIAVKPFNLTVADLGEFAMELVDAATVIFGTPFVLTGAHPAVVYAAYFTGALKPKIKNVGILTSFGWGGKTLEQLKSLLGGIKVDYFEPIQVKGMPREKDIEALNNLANLISKKHKNLEMSKGLSFDRI